MNTVSELWGQGRLRLTQDNKIIINGNPTNTSFQKFLKNIKKIQRQLNLFIKMLLGQIKVLIKIINF